MAQTGQPVAAVFSTLWRRFGSLQQTRFGPFTVLPTTRVADGVIPSLGQPVTTEHHCLSQRRTHLCISECLLHLSNQAYA
jgi:hypothetical protein